MRPARQGDLDGLCGVYALINALDLIGFKRSRSVLHEQLFGSLTAALPSKKLRAAMTSLGLEGPDLVKAAHLAFPEFYRALGGYVRVSRPFARSRFPSDEAFVDALAMIVSSKNQAAIINVSTPKYRHWSVVDSLMPERIKLRDSWSLHELPRDRYTIKRGRYRISPQETLLVRLVP